MQKKYYKNKKKKLFPTQKKKLFPTQKKKDYAGVEPGTTGLKAQHLNPLGHISVLLYVYKLLYISLIHDKYARERNCIMIFSLEYISAQPIEIRTM